MKFYPNKNLDKATSKGSLNGNHKETVVLTVRVQGGELLSLWEPLEVIGRTVGVKFTGRWAGFVFEVAEVGLGRVEAVGDHSVTAPSANWKKNESFVMSHKQKFWIR